MTIFHHDPRLDQLRQIDVLAGLSLIELTEVARLTTAVSVRPGESLCVQGRTGDQVFLVLSGQVGIARDGMAVAVVGAGSLVGEMAVLGRVPRSATAVAMTDVSVLVMSVREFTQLISMRPDVADRIHALGEARRAELATA